MGRDVLRHPGRCPTCSAGASPTSACWTSSSATRRSSRWAPAPACCRAWPASGASGSSPSTTAPRSSSSAGAFSARAATRVHAVRADAHRLPVPRRGVLGLLLPGPARALRRRRGALDGRRAAPGGHGDVRVGPQRLLPARRPPGPGPGRQRAASLTGHAGSASWGTGRSTASTTPTSRSPPSPAAPSPGRPRSSSACPGRQAQSPQPDRGPSVDGPASGRQTRSVQ